MIEYVASVPMDQVAVEEFSDSPRPAEEADKNVESFSWTEADVAALAASDRSPQTVARAAKELVIRNCAQRACSLRGRIVFKAGFGEFLGDADCDGPQRAARMFLAALDEATNTTVQPASQPLN